MFLSSEIRCRVIFNCQFCNYQTTKLLQDLIFSKTNTINPIFPNTHLLKTVCLHLFSSILSQQQVHTHTNTSKIIFLSFSISFIIRDGIKERIRKTGNYFYIFWSSILVQERRKEGETVSNFWGLLFKDERNCNQDL